MVDGSKEGWMHRALCLEAEIQARNAANEHLGNENCILEKGLREAKAEILRLKRIIEFRHGPGSAASRNEAKK